MEKRGLDNEMPIGRIKIRNVERGVSYPEEENFLNIPAWSRGAKPYDQLSPFKIGPVTFGDKECPTFETFWQAQKVWKKVSTQKSWQWTWKSETHVDEEENPNENWHIWHEALLKNKHAVRRPNGRNIPLYAWWHGKKLGIVEARKEIYIPYLQTLYRAHPVYKKLYKLVVEEGKNICILEPDGPKHWLFENGAELDLETLYALQNVTELKDFPGLTDDQTKTLESGKRYVPYGHGYVLALTLLEDSQKSHKKIKIIDA